MDEPLIPVRRPEWTEEDEKKFIAFVKREGFGIFQRKLEHISAGLVEEMIQKKDLTFVDQIKAISHVLRVCDNARR